MAASPIAVKLEKRLLACTAMDKARHKMNKNNARTKKAPINPNSSHITEKIKSVCCSGKKASLVCVPSKNPLPVRPPDPMAILD